MRFAPLVSLLLVAGLIGAACGKVGDPQPPFIRIPEAATDFRVEQVAYELRFRWTNPPRNLDQSAATDLDEALIRAGDVVVAVLEASAGGESQGFELPVRNLVGVTREYSILFSTEAGRLSEPSPPVEVAVLEVPEGGAAPEAIVDQGRIRIEWPPPVVHPEIVDGFRIYRSGELLASEVSGRLFYDDAAFTEDESYEYSVVPLRSGPDGFVEGVPYLPVEVVARDRTPPSPPLDPAIVGFDGSAFVRWQAAPESDVVRYRVYRRADPGAGFVRIDDGEQTVTAYLDPDYESGFEYAVSAVDESGNESVLSETDPGP